jgi:hypothetical protein
MQFDRIQKLREDYTDQYVVVDASRPELVRFKGAVGQVKTINHNGRALVQFDLDSNRGWYDIDLDFLKVVEKPAPKAAEPKAKASPAPKAAKTDGASTAEMSQEKLSPLELARVKKEAQQATGNKADVS